MLKTQSKTKRYKNDKEGEDKKGEICISGRLHIMGEI